MRISTGKIMVALKQEIPGKKLHLLSVIFYNNYYKAGKRGILIFLKYSDFSLLTYYTTTNSGYFKFACYKLESLHCIRNNGQELSTGNNLLTPK